MKIQQEYWNCDIWGHTSGREGYGEISPHHCWLLPRPNISIQATEPESLRMGWWYTSSRLPRSVESTWNFRFESFLKSTPDRHNRRAVIGSQERSRWIFSLRTQKFQLRAMVDEKNVRRELIPRHKGPVTALPSAKDFMHHLVMNDNMLARYYTVTHACR